MTHNYHPTQTDVLPCQPCQWCNNSRETFDEASVVSSQPKKIVNLHYILWSLPLKNGVNFGWIHQNLFLRNYMTQKLHFSHSEIVFLLLSKQLMLF